MRTVNIDNFLDKIHGCWYGKCLGGAAGAPFEGIKKIIEVNDFTQIFNPDLPNDDLDIQLLWLEVLENKGLNINSENLAEAWIEKCWYPFSEYGYFIKNYKRGIKPPYSGIINNSFFKEGMGCPIRSEIWGIICAGNPQMAVKYAYIDATLDHAENSVYAEQFLAAAESIAFVEDNTEKIISLAMKYVPNESKLYKCLSDVIIAYKDGKSWEAARKIILSKYSHPDFTNVVQNMGFVLIALLYGNSDMRSTINIALRCGYDTDCTCASAASIVGIINGYKGLGEEINGLIKDYFVCGIDVTRPSDSIKGLAEDCMRIALQMKNDCLTVIGNPAVNKITVNLNIEMADNDGLKKELNKISPIVWKAYGPYFSQLEQPIDTKYPSPHGEGCVLPDLVCMVNNQVHLDDKYINESELYLPEENYIGRIDAYEDIIPIENTVSMSGQMCIYLKTTIISPKKQRIWGIIGNSDGFKLWVNKEELLSKNEIRMYTPYNNFCYIDLNEGKNEVILKLLRRTDELKFAIGFRKYDGCHWHRSQWCTDLVYDN